MKKDQQGSLKAVIVALCSNFFVTILKFVGWFISSSPSMLAEALHSLADVMNQSLLYIGIKGSQGGLSAKYPWGRGAVQYLFNFMSAIGIFALSCILTIYHAIHDYLNPSPVTNSHLWINLSILIVAAIVEGYSCFVAVKEVYKRKGKKKLWKFLKDSDDPTLVGVFLEDSAAILGILFAISGIALSKILQSNLPDIFGALVIGAMMGLIAVFLGLSNARFLIGTSSGKKKEKEYKEFIEALPTVETVTELRTEILGPNKVHLYIEVELHGMLMVNRDQMMHDAHEIEHGNITAIEALMDVYARAVRDIGREINKIEEQIKKEFPEIISIDFEMR